MTRTVNVNGREWELFDAGPIFEPAGRHRPTDERKVAVLEEVFAALQNGNFTEVARQYCVAYYADAVTKDEASKQENDQVKSIAKNLRKRSSK